MDASIISKVSQIILENRLGYKLPKRSRKNEGSSDTVQISSVASEASQIAKALDKEYEDRAAKVEAIKKQIQKGSYKLSEEMVDQIAVSRKGRGRILKVENKKYYCSSW